MGQIITSTLSDEHQLNEDEFSSEAYTLNPQVYIQSREVLPDNIPDDVVLSFSKYVSRLTVNLERTRRVYAVEALAGIYVRWVQNPTIRKELDKSPVLANFILHLSSNDLFDSFLQYDLPDNLSILSSNTSPFPLSIQLFFAMDSPMINRLKQQPRTFSENLSFIFSRYARREDRTKLYRKYLSMTSSLSPLEKLTAIEMLLMYRKIKRSNDPKYEPETDPDLNEFRINLANSTAFRAYIDRLREDFNTNTDDPEELTWILYQMNQIEKYVLLNTRQLTGIHQEIASVMLREILKRLYRKHRSPRYSYSFNNHHQDEVMYRFFQAIKSNKAFEKYMLEFDPSILKGKYYIKRKDNESRGIHGLFDTKRKYKRVSYKELDQDEFEKVMSIYEKSPRVYSLMRSRLFTEEQITLLIRFFEMSIAKGKENGLDSFLNRMYKRYKQDPNVINFCRVLYRLSSQESIDGNNPYLDAMEDEDIRNLFIYIRNRYNLEFSYSYVMNRFRHYLSIKELNTGKKVELIFPIRVTATHNPHRDLKSYIEYIQRFVA